MLSVERAWNGSCWPDAPRWWAPARRLRAGSGARQDRTVRACVDAQPVPRPLDEAAEGRKSRIKPKLRALDFDPVLDASGCPGEPMKKNAGMYPFTPVRIFSSPNISISNFGLRMSARWNRGPIRDSPENLARNFFAGGLQCRIHAAVSEISVSRRMSASGGRAAVNYAYELI